MHASYKQYCSSLCLRRVQKLVSSRKIIVSTHESQKKHILRSCHTFFEHVKARIPNHSMANQYCSPTMNSILAKSAQETPAQNTITQASAMAQASTIQELHENVRRALIFANNAPNLALAEHLLRDFSSNTSPKNDFQHMLTHYLAVLRIYSKRKDVEGVSRIARILLENFGWEIEWREKQNIHLLVKVDENGKASKVATETWIHLWRAYALEGDFRIYAIKTRQFAELAFEKQGDMGMSFEEAWEGMLGKPVFDGVELG